MTKIPEKFKKWGDSWTLIKKGEKCALYLRQNEEDYRNKHYEVVGFKILPEDIDAGIYIIKAGEKLCLTDKDYGVNSFCFTGCETGKQQSINKFNKIENEKYPSN